MTHDAREEYLKNQIETATPQKLHLMLVEGAIRYARVAQNCWRERKEEDARDAVDRCYLIIVEMLSNVGAAESALGRRISSVYLFLFQTVAEVRQQRDDEKLNDLLRVLAIERETWRQVCQKFGATASQGTRAEGRKNVPPRPGMMHREGPARDGVSFHA